MEQREVEKLAVQYLENEKKKIAKKLWEQIQICDVDIDGPFREREKQIKEYNDIKSKLKELTGRE